MIETMVSFHFTLRALCTAAGVVAAVGVAVVLGGCGVSQGRVGEVVLEDTSAPVVRGAEAGLEVRLWVVENRSGVLGGLFREFGAPAFASTRSVELWRSNGFRVLEVPLERLEDVRAGLPTIGPLHREWMGLLPEWVEVVKGAELSGQREIRLDNGTAVLGPGRLRLVTRCWTVPSVGVGTQSKGVDALLHVEVMPQLGIVRRGRGGVLDKWLGVEHESSRTAVQGMAFDRLMLRMTSQRGKAIVIVPEDPSVDWDAEASGRPESRTEAQHQDVIGPQMLAMPTLGDLMLTSLALPETVGDARVVVVLVPRVPERFEFLPR